MTLQAGCRQSRASPRRTSVAVVQGTVLSEYDHSATGAVGVTHAMG